VSEDSAPVPKADEDLLRAYLAVFKNEAGQRVLRHMSKMARVEWTITEEETRGQPIDPVKFQVGEGMRRLYWKIQAQIQTAELLGKD